MAVEHDQGMAAFKSRPGDVLEGLERATSGKQTTIVQKLDLWPTAQPCSLVFFPGPSHESNLPRRPPSHWHRPPRESVVIALLPWRMGTCGRLGSGPIDPDTGSRRDQKIEASPTERKQWLFETDHLKAQGRWRESSDPRAQRKP